MTQFKNPRGKMGCIEKNNKRFLIINKLIYEKIDLKNSTLKNN